MKINHVKQTVNCFSETLPLFCIFPIWRTFHASQKFVNELLKHCAYIESSENITSEILFRKGKFKEAGNLLHDALCIRERTLGRDHPAVSAASRD